MPKGSTFSVPIKVRNLQRAVRIDIEALQSFGARAVPQVLAARKSKSTDLAKLREVSILLISDRRMASLHGQFLGQRGPTDVITFSHGEIFISAETARRQARQFKNTLSRELALYVVHGLLHLHGFEDADAAEARKMDQVQEQILRAVGN